MKADEYRYWQGRPGHERLNAVEDMIQTAYVLKGWKTEPDVPRHKDLLSAFHAHGVKYLIVGGYAVILHAQPRFTKDLDFPIGCDPGNARATYAALADFGAPLQGIRPKDFADRGSFFRFG